MRLPSNALDLYKVHIACLCFHKCNRTRTHGRWHELECATADTQPYCGHDKIAPSAVHVVLVHDAMASRYSAVRLDPHLIAVNDVNNVSIAADHARIGYGV